MAAVWFAVRAPGRGARRLLVVALLAILIGIAGGAVLTAVAGARRTDTAYDRLLAQTDAPQLVVRPVGGPEAADPDDVAALPQVAQAGEARRYNLTFPVRQAGKEASILPTASVDGRALYTIGRPEVIEGRLPRRDRADEVLVSRTVRDQADVRVGDVLRTTLFQIDADEPDGVRTERVPLRVVGVGYGADEIGFERVGGFQLMLTPAFHREHADFSLDWNELVNLRPGASPAAFRRAVDGLTDTGRLDVASRADDEGRVERATQPPVVSLWVFAFVLAIVAMFVLGPTIARQLFVEARDDPLLGALGLTRRQRFLLGEVRVLPMALAGAVLAVLVAIAASPLMPIGVAESAEPNPGVEVNVAVLALGALAVAVGILALAAIPAWRLAGLRVGDDAAADRRARPSRVVAWLARTGASPTAVNGTRFALESGRGPTAVPARATLAGTAAAIAALVAALTFAGGLRHLVDTPRLWGVTWDVTANVAADARQLDGEFTLKETLVALQGLVERGLRKVDAVDDWSIATYQTISIDDEPVPALGLAKAGGVALPLREGRFPRDADEVALGASTLDDLGVEVGDVVHAGSHPVKVVGVVVLPQIAGVGGADEGGVGRGAAFTLAGVLQAAPDPYTRAYYIKLRDGADVDRAVVRIQDATKPFAFNVARPFRPSDIHNLDDVQDRPAVLALLLAVMAVGTLVHALATAVRRRRRDLAILATIGFSRFQIAATVAWQATSVAVVGLIVGVPIGVVAGRYATGRLAASIGSVSDAVTPWVALGLVAAGTLVIANLVAALPGLAAARTRPALVLRSE